MPERPRVPAWVFAFTSMPFGIAAAFLTTVLPYLLRKSHIGVEDIAHLVALTYVPSTWQFAWAPLLDLGFRRRTWLVLVSVVGALCLVAALCLPLPARLDALIVLTVAGAALTGLVSSCNGGLIAATLPVSELGRASGWMNAGNLGGGALGAGLLLWLSSTTTRTVTALTLFPLIVLPSLVALLVPEPSRAPQSARATFGTMAREVWGTLRSRRGWSGVLLCLSPVGTAAAINLFTTIAADYHTSNGQVTLVNGWLNAGLTSVGALFGGWACDRIDRRFAYMLAGLLSAFAAVGMLLGPLAPWVYTVGCMSYMLVAGFCYAAFSAFVLEIIGGQDTRTAATQYTLFTASANGAIGYVIWLDGIGYKEAGPRGLLGTDAALNLVGVALLGPLLWLLLRRRGGAAPLAATPSAA